MMKQILIWKTDRLSLFFFDFFALWGHQICCCIANDKIQVFSNTCLLVFFPIRLFNSSYAKSCERSDACQGYWYHDHSHYIISMIMIWRRMPIYPFLIIHLTRGKNKLKLATFAKYKPG